MARNADSHIGERSNLTTSQLMIWTGQRLQPGDPLYNMILSFRIRGDVDPVLFARAFQALVDRCDALRAVVDVVDGVPQQRFDARPVYATPLVDLSQQASPAAALDDWIVANRGRDFDLSDALFHSVLIKLGDEDFVWYLNQHHIMTDAWAVGVLYQQMQALYGVARDGDLEAVAALPDFAAFAQWERRQRASARHAKLAEYWSGKLETPFTPSGFYHRPPAQRSGRTDRVAVPLGPERSAKLRALAAEPGYRAFSPDLAHFQIFATVLMAWLHRLNGHRRLAIGTPSHNRATAQHKATAGLFIELFPLQASIEDAETFASLCKKVAADTHQLLLHAAPGASGFGHNRAFDVVLNFITASFGDFAGMPMQSEWIHADFGDRNHQLRLQVQDFDRSHEFGLYFDVNVDTFDQRERSWATAHFLKLLDAFLSDPERPIDSVALVGAEESRRLLVDLNGEPVAASGETVVDRFERQVALSPDKVALREAERTVSYADLSGRVQRLSAGLTDRGIGRDQRVAILSTRSVDAVTAILGVLKAGAAYVPLDAAHPPQRIAQILTHADVALVLTEPALAALVPDTVASATVASILTVSTQDGDASAASDAPTGPAADDTAYIIYTSGSTGQPKGVVVKHAALANYIDWASRQYGGSAVFPLYSSLAFDLTVTSLFTPLTGGGELVIYPEDPSGREISIRRVIEDNRAQVVKLTPVHLALIRNMDFSESNIRCLVVGGEDFKTDLARAIERRFGGRAEIYNEYGPTEATVACMIHRFDAAQDTGASVPIGRAIDNLEIYLLDRHGEPVPQGVTGELCIGGAGVASGYLGLDDATAARFVPNPHRAGGKMYRSGDLARWTREGVVEYLGRADHQVKIRGVRIETGEVEAALLSYPGIRECVVDAVQTVRPAQADAEAFCVECGISARHPDSHLDADSICRICRAYADEPEKAAAYFCTTGDLEKIVRETKAAAGKDGPDSMMLLSGGKDSTYALCRLVDMGLKPLVFTLDNGFISEDAKTNIRRVCERLGLELVSGSTPAMNEIFADSLARHSNVCQGCFKTIYTLSMKLAHERGIRTIFTGLSRGQIFETRIADLFRQQVFDPGDIDRTIVEARKAYHRMDDAVSRCLDVSLFRDDRIFEQIRFVDFYRYSDVRLDEVYRYLATQAPWIRPRDTGRSTNCLINEAGIYVHKTERGFHNYSLPYSWDVRLGHKDRDAAREELDDNIDVDNVRRILAEVGYQVETPVTDPAADRRLAAWYVADRSISDSELARYLATRLPREYVPASFVALSALPQTANAKIDREALPRPDDKRPELATPFAAPVGDIETSLAAIWAELLGVDDVGRDDNFFDLGGDSIINIQIVARARGNGLLITPQQIFDHPTIAGLAGAASEVGISKAEQGFVTGVVPMTPMQQRFFQRMPRNPHHFNQTVTLDVPGNWDAATIGEAWRLLSNHHDVLRANYRRTKSGWRQRFTDALDRPFDVTQIDMGGLRDADRQSAVDGAANELNASLNIETGRVCGLSLMRHDANQATLLIVVHHLVIDGVSWWVLLNDLEQICVELCAQRVPDLPAKASSLRQWADALKTFAGSPAAAAQIPYWRGAAASDLPLPVDRDGPNDRISARDVEVTLDKETTTQLLHGAPAAYSVQVPDLLLTALAQTLTAWTGQSRCQIALEGHGRDALDDSTDVLRCVGWFTSLYPVTLDPGGTTPGDALKNVKETLRSVPSRGIGYGVLRYLGANAAELAASVEPPVLFNYMGQWDKTLSSRSRLAFKSPIRASFDGEGERAQLLEVNAMVFDGRLQVTWTHSIGRHDTDTVQRLADDFMLRLTTLIEFCIGSGLSGHTPSDFPAADLNQDDLDALLADFGE